MSVRAPNFISVVIPSILRNLATLIPLTTHGIFYQTDIGEALRFQVIHGAFDALGAVRAGHNYVNLASERRAWNDRDRQAEILDFLRGTLCFVLALEAAHPEVTGRVVVHGGLRDGLVFAEPLARGMPFRFRSYDGVGILILSRRGFTRLRCRRRFRRGCCF